MFENPTLEISIDDIIPPYLMLRLVSRRSLDYMELRDSIYAHGILNSILVRRSSRTEGKYEVIDGMYRLSCAKDLGFKQIPCIVVSASDEEALLMQVQANMQRPPTKRADFAMHLKRLFAADPDLTFDALAAKLNKNPQWIKSTLRLTRLCDAAKKELNAGNLTLVAAHAMCQLPQKLQEEFLPKALCMCGKDAAIICNSMTKKYLEDISTGQAERFYEFQVSARPYLRTLKMVVKEYKNPICGAVILNSQDAENLSPIDIWKQALAWVLHIDTDSIKQQEAKQLSRIQKREEDAKQRLLQREALRKQKELGISEDWRVALIED